MAILRETRLNEETFCKTIWPSYFVLISLHWCHCPQNANKTEQNKTAAAKQQQSSIIRLIIIIIYFPLQSRKLYCGKIDKAASRQQFISYLHSLKSIFLLQCIAENKQQSNDKHYNKLTFKPNQTDNHLRYTIVFSLQSSSVENKNKMKKIKIEMIYERERALRLIR